MTTTKRLSLAMCFASAGALWMAHTGSAQSADPWVGAWTLNLSKSTFSPGPPHRRNALKIEPVAGRPQHIELPLRLGQAGFAGDEIDRAAERITPKLRRLRPLDHFDALKIEE